MNALFLKIMNMSISAGWLILAVLILRLILKKAPRWVFVLLWGIAAVRLICPFSFESAWSLIPSAETVPEKVLSGPSFYLQTGIAPIDHQINGYLGDSYFEGVTVPANHGFQVMTVFAVIWVMGILLLTGYTIVSYWRLYCRVDTAVRCKENIYQSENVSSPFVLGIIKPRIYLPFQLDGQTLEYVVAHEQAHILRKDHWWKPLGFLLLTVHWFNPLVWAAYVFLCRDIEFACDEKVVREFGNEQRAGYLQALVICSGNRRTIAACPLAFGEVSIKERVKSVMNYQRPSFRVIFLSVIVCAAVAAGFLTDPKQDCFSLRIVVPAGSRESIVYADEEISPLGSYMIVTADEGSGEIEVSLKTAEVKTETAYDEPVCLIPVRPVKLKAEKGGWFKIGVNMQNDTEEDKIVCVKIENVEVRREESGSEEIGQYRTDYIGDASKVSQIAQHLPYPEDYRYSSIELQTQAEPYELIVYLTGMDSVQEESFESCAATAFELIGNMGAITFCGAESGETIASFLRMDLE